MEVSRTFHGLFWHVLVLAMVFVGAIAHGQDPTAYDVSYLSCWQGRDQTDFGSRQQRTAILVSHTGAKAFGTVVATASSTGSCQNTTTLFASDGKTEPENVYRVSREGTQDGNGIRLVAWSPSGRKLLAEITTWAYGSDAGLGKLLLVYDTVTKHASELTVFPQLIAALGEKCDLQVSAMRWISDGEVLVSAKRQLPESDTEATSLDCPPTQHFFRLDVSTDQLKPYHRAR